MKDFKYKSFAEIEDMSEEQKDAYGVAKREHEQELSAKKAEEIVNEKLKQLNVDEKLQGVAKSDDIKELLKAEALEEVKKEFAEKFEKLDKSMEDLGKSHQPIIKKPMNRLKDELIEKFTKAFSESKGNKSNINGYEFTIKDDAADTHTISDVDVSVYPDGSTSNVDATTLITYGQRVGNLWANPLRKLNLLNYINVQELTGQYLLRDILHNEVGQAEFVPECGIKPIVKEDVKTESSKAGKIALRFRMSEEYQKFVPQFVQNRIISRFKEKLDIALVDAIFGNNPDFEGIIENAAGYVPSISHTIFSNPNHLDAIAAGVNSLELRDYSEFVIAVNPSEKLALLNVKGNDEHYQVFNNGSIQMVNGSMAYVNGDVHPITFDKTIAQGSIFIAAANDTFEVAADRDMTVRMGYDKDGDLRRNILTIVMEKFVAVSAPAEVGDGMLYDTFDNIKTLITA